MTKNEALDLRKVGSSRPAWQAVSWLSEESSGSTICRSRRLSTLPSALAALTLPQNAPNPFNPSTTIRCELHSAYRVRLRVNDPSGRPVRTLRVADELAGRHSVIWRGINDRGRPLPSGLYLCRLEASAEVQTKRRLLIKEFSPRSKVSGRNS